MAENLGILCIHVKKLTPDWGLEPLFSVWAGAVKSLQKMRIQITGLSEGIHDYHFDTTAAELFLGDQFDGPVSVDTKLDRSGNQILLKGSIRAASSVQCDRCATPFIRNLSPSYQMYYVWNEPDAASFDPSEVQVISPGLSVIALDEDVRQTILLSLPLKILCREDCRGLCPRCGKNLNDGPCSCGAQEKDPRWDHLRSAMTGGGEGDT